jgi:hypothetical protein
MLPFIYSLIQHIYVYNQIIYNFGKEDKDINNSSTTKYNFDSFNETPSIIIYSSLYSSFCEDPICKNPKILPYYGEIEDAFTDPEKEHIIEQKTHSIKQKKHSKEQKKHSIEQKKHSIEQKKHSIVQKYPFSIVKKLQEDKKIENKYIPIGCKQDGTIAYAYVSLINK